MCTVLIFKKKRPQSFLFLVNSFAVPADKWTTYPDPSIFEYDGMKELLQSCKQYKLSNRNHNAFVTFAIPVIVSLGLTQSLNELIKEESEL